jgi:hypothetical protein
MPPEQVISWVLVVSLPLTLPLAVLTWPEQPVRPAAWGALAYLSVFSMWLGFFDVPAGWELANTGVGFVAPADKNALSDDGS